MSVGPEPPEDLVVGVDVGGSKILTLAVDGAGQVSSRHLAPTPSPQEGVDALERAIADAVRHVQPAAPGVTAVGVAVAGWVDAEGTRVDFAPHLAWRGESVRDRLGRLLGVPVWLENDATAALWGEHRFGAAQGAHHAVLVTLGTGIGGGALVDGRLMRGAQGHAGEFGHMKFKDPGRECACGQRGCWEEYVSGHALGRRGRKAYDDPKVTGPDVVTRGQANDPVACDLLAGMGRALGEGLANLAAAFDPALIVVGGGLAEVGEPLLGPARETLAARLPGAGHRDPPAVVAAALGPDAGAIGVADLARRLR